jgi:probable DNA metabolism protein
VNPVRERSDAVRVLRIDGTFEGWRDAARAELRRGAPPASITFTEEGQLGLLAAEAEPPYVAGPAPRVPPRFLSLARWVACHREPSRWDRLYRVLWRAACDGGPVLEDAADEDVLALTRMERAVRDDVERLRALARFRRIAVEGDEVHVAFHRPAHRTLRLAAPHFAQRYAPMRWSILTPSASAHWDRRALTFGPGVPRDPATPDEAEELWRAYYASTFNPARVNERLLRAHLPRRHWETLPEAREIPDLVRRAREST